MNLETVVVEERKGKQDLLDNLETLVIKAKKVTTGFRDPKEYQDRQDQRVTQEIWD